MTTTETAAILRQYNTWRRGNLEWMPQPDPREIGEAIDAAIEMIDRLEAAEAEALEQARLNGMGSEREAALMAKLEAAEKDVALKEEVIASLGVAVKRLDAQCDAAERERDKCNRRRLEAADHFAAQTALMKEKYDALRAKIEAMKRQEQVATVIKKGSDRYWMSERMGTLPDGTYPLYTLPGAKGEEPTPSIPEGWKLVSIEPTEEMYNAGANHCDGYWSTAQAVWDAMLAVAPEAKP